VNIKRTLKFIIQRIVRGWTDEDTWSMDWTISKYILPRLKRFKKINNGYPNEFKSIKEWNGVIDDMIFSFNAIANQIETPMDDCLVINFDKDYEKDEKGNTIIRFNPNKEQKIALKKYKKESKILNDKIQKGLDLFGKYFRGLWW